MSSIRAIDPSFKRSGRAHRLHVGTYGEFSTARTSPKSPDCDRVARHHGALFISTTVVPQPGFWILLVRATAEAAVVGALADWFAVTALFRRPLGLPIPHTAIVPKSKDRIGEGLATFIEHNFLTPELIKAKLRSIDIAWLVANWLSCPRQMPTP
jgi:uncharacterized membrane-anchored protein YjiN (DUF445 family)